MGLKFSRGLLVRPAHSTNVYAFPIPMYHYYDNIYCRYHMSPAFLGVRKGNFARVTSLAEKLSSVHLNSERERAEMKYM